MRSFLIPAMLATLSWTTTVEAASQRLADQDLDRVTAGNTVTADSILDFVSQINIWPSPTINHPGSDPNGNVGFGNTGENNFGLFNSGSGNRGIRNEGNQNTGIGNAGNRNSGIGNAGNRNTGIFLRGGQNTGIGSAGFPDGVLGNNN